MCVNNLPRDAFDSGVAGIRTRDLLIATSQVQHTATPSEVIYGNKIILSPNVPYVYWATFYTFYKPTVDYYMKFNTMRHVYKQSKQEAQLMLTTGSTRLAVSRGQQTWYHSTCNI